MGSLISALYKTPPVSGRDYLVYMGNKFHVPGTPLPVYAADPIGGQGYNSLTPILKIWTVMRNLAYFFFAIMFIVAGVMILVRSKIDPKTTVNIQNALPKIIFALVLVTFSYAIAGFLIDIMYVAIALVVTIIGSIDTDTKSLIENIVKGSIFRAYLDGNTWGIIGSGAQEVNLLINQFLSGTALNLWGVTGTITGVVLGGLAFLIIAIAILWALFKTWLALLSAYANTILGIIFSPLQLMVDAIPGQNQFEGWLRTMLSNLLPFPVVIAMIGIGQILAKTSTGNVGINPGFVPPLIGGSDMAAVQALIGIAIILTIPKAVEMMQEVLKAPKQKWGTAWGEAMGWAVQRGPVGVGRDLTSGLLTVPWQAGTARGEIARWVARMIRPSGRAPLP